MGGKGAWLRTKRAYMRTARARVRQRACCKHLCSLGLSPRDALRLTLRGATSSVTCNART
eukprot:977511-Pleurochrysis_carterae.AAC.1